MSNTATNKLLVAANLLLVLVLIITHVLISPIAAKVNVIVDRDMPRISDKVVELELRIQALEIQFIVIEKKLDRNFQSIEVIKEKL